MSAKIYVNILKYGVFASFLTIFLVFTNLLFPYITSKQIVFNVIIEILLIFWLALLVKYPEYRPQKSFITYGLLAYFAVIIISCFTGVDFNLSFWGDIERMLGVFHLLHFLALYFIIITVFRERQDWKLFLVYSMVLSVLVSLYAITNNKADSTFGNTEYVGGYLLFNIYFCFLLFFAEKSRALRWLYLLPLPVLFWSFKMADVTGAYVGLGLSFLLLSFLYGLLNKNKKIKIFALIIFGLLVAATLFVMLNKKGDFVQNNSLLRPFAEISLQKNTFQTRLISWKTAFQDFHNHPVLGTGYGNFSITFDKYFDPKFYNYTRGETYFDKAHNNIVEVFSTTGLLGLATYLLIWAALAYYLLVGYIKKKISIHEFILISCLLAAYFIHNFAVFDALVTYLVFMMTLAYVHWLSSRDEEEIEIRSIGFVNKEIYALVVASAVLLTIAYQYNIKVYNMLSGTIDGQKAFAQGQVTETVDIYKQALSQNTVLDRDSRSSLINLFVGNPAIINNISPDKKGEVIDYLISLAEANVKLNKYDSLMQMTLAQVYNLAAMANIPNNGQGDTQQFYKYSDKSVQAINASIEASPGRVPIYFQKAQILLTRGEKDQAVATLQYATTLNPVYPDSFCYLGRAYLLLSQEKQGYEQIGKCLDIGAGTDILSSADLVKGYINHYAEVKDWPRVISLYKVLVDLEANNADNWVQLAALYKQQGDIENAKKAAQKVIDINPSLQAQAREFIDSLK
jgi:O-antigen ligase